jgi:outer membrane biosynthesis protein TonB
MSEPTREQPVMTPTVSTAPSSSRWSLSNIPSHVGPARTSTLVMTVLFLAIFALYLNVRPPATPAATTPAGTDTEQSIVPTTPDPAPTTETTVPAPAPGTTSPEEETTPTEEPTQAPTETTAPPATTTPAPQTTAPLPTSAPSPSTGSSSPTTTVSPPG